MNHYAKLAAVGVRVAAAIVFMFGLVGLLYTIGCALLGLYPLAELARYFYSGIIYTILGVIIFLLGKVIGRFVARGIE